MLWRDLANRRQHDPGVPKPEAERERCADQLPRLLREGKGNEGDKGDQATAHDDESTRSQLSNRQPDRYLRCANNKDPRCRCARHRRDITQWHPGPFKCERKVGVDHGDAEDLGKLHQHIDRDNSLPRKTACATHSSLALARLRTSAARTRISFRTLSGRPDQERTCVAMRGFFANLAE